MFNLTLKGKIDKKERQICDAREWYKNEIQTNENASSYNSEKCANRILMTS